MGWFKKHKHDWKEIARTYAPGVSAQEGEYSGVSPAILLRIQIEGAQGKTTILWECNDCQTLRREEMSGKEVKS